MTTPVPISHGTLLAGTGKRLDRLEPSVTNPAPLSGAGFVYQDPVVELEPEVELEAVELEELELLLLMLLTFVMGTVTLPISTFISESPLVTAVMVPLTVKVTSDVVPAESMVLTATL